MRCLSKRRIPQTNFCPLILPKIDVSILGKIQTLHNQTTRIMAKTNATEYLGLRLGLKQEEYDFSILRGILQTEDYEHFEIRSDVGDLLHVFNGAKQANRCLPGDHVQWNAEKGECILELSDEHPLLAGTLHLTQPHRYGYTTRKIPLYLFTPYDSRYPCMIVGSSEKDKTSNCICLVQVAKTTVSDKSTFPRAHLQQMLGRSGDIDAEKSALIHQVCPWKYPRITFHPTQQETVRRIRLTGTTFHVDPVGCRDVDDVITLEQVGDDEWKVIITISDVATYVEEGNAVDIMASLISQTVYDHEGRVLHPMLPKEYAELTCSLLPGPIKYGVSMALQWNGKQKTLSEPVWYESEMVVDRSYTYEEFQTESSDLQRVVKDVASVLAGESLEDAHKWIEQLMIRYNQEAGKKLRHAGIGILRRHASAEQERVERYREHLPEWKFLAMSSAEYVLAEEKDTYHSGLGTDAYAHTTSPIRRYADLVNQRALKALLHAPSAVLPYTFIVPVTMFDLNRREQTIRQFEREMTFLGAIQRGESRTRAIVIDVANVIEGVEEYEIQFYLPAWKKRVFGRYRKAGENQILTRDETEVRNIPLYGEIEIQCSIQWSMRHWKKRLLVQWV